MHESSRIKPPHWAEPAHPGVIKFRDDLVSLLTAVREKAQPAFDESFDQVARQIGFVVATTLPVVYEVDAASTIQKVQFASCNLQGTVFEKGFAKPFESLVGLKAGADKAQVAAGSYKTYVIWLSALALRLRYDWLEPAHWAKIDLSKYVDLEAGPLFDYSPIEPAQWFDAGIAISYHEALTVLALDQVYPELALVERLGQIRARQRTVVGPGVHEPAHQHLKGQ